MRGRGTPPLLIGPQVAGLEVSEFIRFFSALGLGMLFFFAGRRSGAGPGLNPLRRGSAPH